MKGIVLRVAISFVVGSALVSSCSVKHSKTIEKQMLDEHTSQNALDWQGRYEGTLPCADCDGIATELSLNHDGSYVLVEVWHKNEESSADTLRGHFTWQGNAIKLHGISNNRRPSLYKVEENRIRQLDMQGKQITGGLAEHYVLSKMGNLAVEDKRWQIVELNGKAINGSPETHYLIFHSREKRLEAKINCNVILRNYQITNQFKLQINQGLSSLMACPDGLEQELIQVLDMADNISVGEERLTLNKGRMAPLLSLKLIQTLPKEGL